MNDEDKIVQLIVILVGHEIKNKNQFQFDLKSLIDEIAICHLS